MNNLNKNNDIVSWVEYGEQILHDAGKITAEIARSFAENEYDQYKPIQDRLFESDFDKLIKESLKGVDCE